MSNTFQDIVLTSPKSAVFNMRVFYSTLTLQAQQLTYVPWSVVNVSLVNICLKYF